MSFAQGHFARAFGITQRIERFVENHSTFTREGREIHVPGLFYRFDNRAEECGHVRLFRKPLGGWPIYMWHRTSPGWAMTRVWWFGLVSFVHIDAGPDGKLKHCTSPGWHVRFAKFKFERIYGGFSLSFRSADKGYTA